MSTLNKLISIVHLTSAHPRNDIRIYIKQCKSLADYGYSVYLVVADGNGDDFKDGVNIVDVKWLPGRINRMIRTTQKIFIKASSINADIYHLHDPELIPIGLKLKKLGKKVIFDSHEDVSKQFLSKPYLTPYLLRILSKAFSLYERYSCAKLDGIITATPFIRDKFLTINPITMDINNFPIIGELDALAPWTEKHNEVCYVGGIDEFRGIRELVRSFEYIQSSVRLNLIGTFVQPSLAIELKRYPGWKRVNELGFLDRTSVKNILKRSIAGLVTFHPTPNHINAQPNKMFEYMSAGIPVIASAFPLWNEIIEGNQCGMCVDPLDPKAIAVAIDQLANNPKKARNMGDNGRKAVLDKYNWSTEEQKLINFYSRIL
jgi:glycosyltransferase involved in cell wall biosynthesis